MKHADIDTLLTDDAHDVHVPYYKAVVYPDDEAPYEVGWYPDDHKVHRNICAIFFHGLGIGKLAK